MILYGKIQINVYGYKSIENKKSFKNDDTDDTLWLQQKLHRVLLKADG